MNINTLKMYTYSNKSKNKIDIVLPFGLYPPQVIPILVTHMTIAPPFLSTALWKDSASHPSRLASYVNCNARNSKFVFFRNGRNIFISASSVSTGSAHSSFVAGYCSVMHIYIYIYITYDDVHGDIRISS